MNSSHRRKILILAAKPNGLRFDAEIEKIKEAIRRSPNRDQLEVESRLAVTPRIIRQAIDEERPQIVHFCGHGQEDGNLQIEDDDSRENFSLAPEGLADLFSLHSEYVKCVLFNVCYSERAAEAIKQHIPYVVSMNHAITDEAAIEFAVAFYDFLGLEHDAVENHQEIYKQAYDRGVVAISIKNISGAHTPVLKMNAGRPDNSEGEDNYRSIEINNRQIISDDQGEIPCLLLYSVSQHIDYIQDIIKPVTDILNQIGFKYDLRNNFSNLDNFSKIKFEQEATKCPLIIVVLDGLSPQVIYQYGFLKGKQKQLLLMQDKQSFVDVKSLYSAEGETGLTSEEYERFKPPFMKECPFFRVFHDENVIEVDSKVSSDSPIHPRNAIKNKIQERMTGIVSQYVKEILEPVYKSNLANIEISLKLNNLVNKVSQYYARPEYLQRDNLGDIFNEINNIQQNLNIRLPNEFTSIVGYLYNRKADNLQL